MGIRELVHSRTGAVIAGATVLVGSAASAVQQQSLGQTPETSGDAGENACTGTPAAPTAPSGTVCIYVSGADNATNVVGYSVLFGTGASPYGFKLKWDIPTGVGDTFVDATWAYTAP